jgi:hypothetical protein
MVAMICSFVQRWHDIQLDAHRDVTSTRIAQIGIDLNILVEKLAEMKKKPISEVGKSRENP